MPEEVISDQVPFDGQNIDDAALIPLKVDVPAEELEVLKKVLKKVIMGESAMSSKALECERQYNEVKIRPGTLVNAKRKETWREELNRVFSNFDSNSDGMITRADLAQYLKKPIPFKLDYGMITVAGLAQKFDADGDGRISKTECDRTIKELFIDDVDDDNGVIYSNADDRFVVHFKNGQLFAPHVEWGRTYPAFSIVDALPLHELPSGDVQGQNMSVSAHATGRNADYCVIEIRDSIRALADKVETCREEDPKFPKLAKIFLILTAEKAAFLLGTSSTRGSSPSAKREGLFYFTIACDTVGVFTSLAAIYMHRKMPKATGVLENIAGFSFVLGFFGMMAQFLA